jgi:predicted MFS family arabinose efflux permease
MVAAHGGWEMAFNRAWPAKPDWWIGRLGLVAADRSCRRGSAQLGPAVLLHLRNPRLVATYAAGFCMLFSLLGVFTYINFYLSRMRRFI